MLRMNKMFCVLVKQKKNYQKQKDIKHYYSQTIRDVHALIILFRENVMLLQKTTKHILLFYVQLVSILLSDANSSINNITKYNSYQSFDVQSAFIYVPVKLFMVKKNCYKLNKILMILEHKKGLYNTFIYK